MNECAKIAEVPYTIKLRTETARYTNWWNNFTKELRTSELQYFPRQQAIDEALKEYNARLFRKGMVLAFKSEKDFTLFLLKYGE